MITVIGSVNMDLIATLPGCPEPGETVIGTDFPRHRAAKGANPGAGGTTRAGASVKMTGAVGGCTPFATEALPCYDEARR